MRIKYSISHSDLSNVIHNKSYAAKGWSLDKKIINSSFQIRNLEYSFIHEDGTIIKNISKAELAKKYSLCKTSVSHICNGKQKQTKGWQLYHP